MRSLAAALVLVCSSVSFGQQLYPMQYPGVPQQSQQVQVQVAPGGNVPSMGPMAPMPPGVPPGVPQMPSLPIHEWRDGFREEWKTIHEIRPVRPEWEHYQRSDGFYYNPTTTCWQRDGGTNYPQFYQPYQPQQYYYQPQYYYPQQRPWYRCW